ncbi:MAG: PadR family transcriptional regulator [Vicinamibacteria bacterium]|jgi:transcriptional regulator|nr:PadR family transcriptional regulator [Vicinamibacteria bacterium]
MAETPLDLLPGTLDLMILRTLQAGPQHGYGIGQRIEQVSGVFRVKIGSLYPALQRLEQAGLVAASWQASEHNRRARYYRLTRRGEARLAREEQDWQRAADGIARVLGVR